MISRIRPQAVLACSIVLVAVASGCGDSDDPGGDGGAQSTGAQTGSGGSEDLKGQRLVFVNYGGITLETAQKTWLTPFQEQTGVEIVTDSPSDPAKVRAMVEAGNPTWDVVDLAPETGAVGDNCGSLFPTREELGVDASQIDPQYITDDCGVPIIISERALLYNKEKYGDNPPTKVTDFLDTENFPGKRSMFNTPTGGFEQLLIADGVEPADLYPLDYDRAGEIIDRLGNDLRLQATTALQGEELASGNFDMCMCYTGRAALSVPPDNVGIVWEKTWRAYDQLYALKGSKAPEAQAALMNYIATPEAQAAFAEVQPYMPTTKDTTVNLPREYSFWVSSEHEDDVGEYVLMNVKWWAENAEEGYAKWAELTAG